MSQKTERDSLLQRLQQVGAALEQQNPVEALRLLRLVRDSGLGLSGLDRTVEQLQNDGTRACGEALNWVTGALATFGSPKPGRPGRERGPSALPRPTTDTFGLRPPAGAGHDGPQPHTRPKIPTNLEAVASAAIESALPSFDDLFSDLSLSFDRDESPTSISEVSELHLSASAPAVLPRPTVDEALVPPAAAASPLSGIALDDEEDDDFDFDLGLSISEPDVAPAGDWDFGSFDDVPFDDVQVDDVSASEVPFEDIPTDLTFEPVPQATPGRLAAPSAPVDRASDHLSPRPFSPETPLPSYDAPSTSVYSLPTELSEPGAIPFRDAPRRTRQNTPMIEAEEVARLREPAGAPADLFTLEGQTESASEAGAFQSPNPWLDFSIDDPVDEEEFFSLGESLASESSYPEVESRPLYRGEPLIKELANEPTPSRIVHHDDEGRSHSLNPFAHEAPTGVRTKSLSELQSGFELEELSKPSRRRSQPNPAVAPPSSPSREVHRTGEQDGANMLVQAQRLYTAGEFQASLDIVSNLLKQRPDPDAERLQQQLERELERVQHERIGSLSRIPVLRAKMSEIAQLNLDHRAGFLLSQIDGMLSFEDIIDMSAMSRLETMTVLAELCEKGVIAGT